MTLQARLHHLHLTTPQPEALASFYARAYAMTTGRGPQAGVLTCAAPGRQVRLSNGPANQLDHALFVFDQAPDHARFQQGLAQRVSVQAPEGAGWPAGSLQVRDPDGNRMVFALAPDASSASAPESSALVPQAQSQHFALRTQQIEPMLAFYESGLGFTVSDRVLDDEQNLRAAFLRSNELHHCLALFSAPVTCFDHQSFETPTWDDLKHWADHMAAQRILIDWGVGRHGPGNDVFFMVRDPDGNLAEISSEIEVCQPGRPVGLWKNEERTLNQWGRAIMRS